MDLELSDDQVALRDGIASMLEARFRIERVRGRLRPRAVRRPRRAPACFSLRADGFALGRLRRRVRAARPRSACRARSCVAAARRRSDRRRRSERRAPVWVEHLDALDASSSTAGRRSTRSIRAADRGRAVAVAARSAARPSRGSRRSRPASPIELDVGRLDARRRGAARPRSCSAWPIGCTEMAVAYAKERVQFDRPIGVVPGDQAPVRRHAACAPRWRAPRCYAAGAALDERATSRASTGSCRARKLLAGEAAIANGKTATQVHGGMGFTWEVDVHLYLKRVGARHALRIRATRTPTPSPRRTAT